MKRSTILIASLLAGGLGVAGLAFAQDHTATMDHNTMDHSAMDHNATDQGMMAAPVIEPGQGAFAAIAEIVAKLESDSTTDWTKVNIAGLRAHLRDMDVVTVDSRVAVNNIDGGVEFTVTGAPDVAPSIQRMTVAHAAVMGGTNGWQFTAKEIDGGAVVTVKVPPLDLDKVRALGFYGVLALGSHHQAHHWMMASGQDPHG